MLIGDVLISSSIHNHDRRMLLPIFVDYGVHNHVAVQTLKLREVSWNDGREGEGRCDLVYNDG